TWKFVRGLTDDQLRIEYDKIRRAVDLATAKAQHQQLKRSGETLESSKSKKLKSSHSTTQPAELQETTSVSAGVPIATEEPLTLTSLLALFPTCMQRIATLEAELKATKILHKDTLVLLDKRIKKLKSKLKTKKRKLVLSDSKKAKAKREKPMTPAQQKEFMRTFVKNQSLAIYTTG
nr:hypothetical protein [Tanacetum cinerariifolium]